MEKPLGLDHFPLKGRGGAGYLAGSTAIVETCCWKAEQVVLKSTIVDGSDGGSEEE